MGQGRGRRARHGGDVAIDFDAVTNSQGAEVKSYALKVERRDATRASVVATIDPGDWLRALAARERHPLLAVASRAGAGAVDDVSGVAEPNAWSLRDMLAHALKP